MPLFGILLSYSTYLILLFGFCFAVSDLRFWGYVTCALWDARCRFSFGDSSLRIPASGGHLQDSIFRVAFLGSYIGLMLCGFRSADSALWSQLCRTASSDSVERNPHDSLTFEDSFIHILSFVFVSHPSAILIIF